jgi:hypothetical protein
MKIMRTLVKSMIFLAVVAICLPVQGEVLIYSKSLKCWTAAEGEGWDITNQSIRGYLVLDVTYDENGDINDIINAYQVEYGRNNGGHKVYTEIEHSFDIIRVVNRNRVVWVLLETNSDESGGEMTMVRGRAINSRIGNADLKEAAKILEGNHLGYWNIGGNEELVMCDWTLRLKEDWTRWINEDEKTIGETMDDIETWLETRGYNPEVT